MNGLLILKVTCPMCLFSSSLLTNGVLFLFQLWSKPMKGEGERLQQGELKLDIKKLGISTSRVFRSGHRFIV